MTTLFANVSLIVIIIGLVLIGLVIISDASLGLPTSEIV